MTLQEFIERSRCRLEGFPSREAKRTGGRLGWSGRFRLKRLFEWRVDMTLVPSCGRLKREVAQPVSESLTGNVCDRLAPESWSDLDGVGALSEINQRTSGTGG